jgi:hypothetical protein
MLTFHDEFGVYSARDENGDVVATGQEALELYRGSFRIEEQKARATSGSILDKTIHSSLLERKIKSWLS